MIYLVRHGESMANTEGKYQGQTYDTELSPLGKKQAYAIAKFFKDKNIKNIYVSPLTRTKETGQAISTALKKPYIVEPLLLETDNGEWSGKSKKRVCDNFVEFCKIWEQTPIEANFPGGEKFADVVNRAKRLLEKYHEENIVFVSHDNTIRAILSVAEDRDVNKMWDYPLENACICELEKSGDKYKLLDINVEHIRELRSDMDTQAF